MFSVFFKVIEYMGGNNINGHVTTSGKKHSFNCSEHILIFDTFGTIIYN